MGWAGPGGKRREVRGGMEGEGKGYCCNFIILLMNQRDRQEIIAKTRLSLCQCDLRSGLVMLGT